MIRLSAIFPTVQIGFRLKEVLTARVNEKIVENRYKQSKTIKGLKIVLIE
jgi:hypothetical protein